jgi:predicted secreted protein
MWNTIGGLCAPSKPSRRRNAHRRAFGGLYGRRHCCNGGKRCVTETAFITLFMAAWLGTCVALLAAAPVFGMVVTAANEEHRAVEAPVGETVVLRLPSTPGTGYAWQVTRIDEDHLKMLGKATYEAPATPSLGSSGYQVFRFLLQKPGSAGVVLDYVRPWEKGPKPVRRFHLEVSIRP